ncbi:unnamed protein product, partial [marine sediment metagenome]
NRTLLPRSILPFKSPAGLPDETTNKTLTKLALLVLHGVDQTIQDLEGYTPRDVANQLRHEETKAHALRILNGPEMYTRWARPLYMRYLDKQIAVDFRDENGHTALWWAACEGDLSRVKKLVKHGANINTLDNGLWTPLHIAAAYDKDDSYEPLEVVHFLVEKGATIDALTDNGFTPLYEAVSVGNFTIARFLISRGANINFINPLNGTSILHSATHDSHFKFILLLLLKGANIDAQAHDGETPLHVSIRTMKHDIPIS